MISKDCKNCEYLDNNKEYPCKLDYPIRCNILYKYVNDYNWGKRIL